MWILCCLAHVVPLSGHRGSVTRRYGIPFGLRRVGVSGKEMALRPSPPQRTVRASFPAYGSSLRSRSSERTGEHNGACLASVREVGLIAGIKRIRIPTDEHVSSDGDRTSAEDSHRSGRIWDTDGAGEHRARSLVGDEVLPQNPRR